MAGSIGRRSRIMESSWRSGGPRMGRCCEPGVGAAHQASPARRGRSPRQRRRPGARLLPQGDRDPAHGDRDRRHEGPEADPPEGVGVQLLRLPDEPLPPDRAWRLRGRRGVGEQPRRRRLQGLVAAAGRHHREHREAHRLQLDHGRGRRRDRGDLPDRRYPVSAVR